MPWVQEGIAHGSTEPGCELPGLESEEKDWLVRYINFLANHRPIIIPLSFSTAFSPAVDSSAR